MDFIQQLLIHLSHSVGIIILLLYKVYGKVSINYCAELGFIIQDQRSTTLHVLPLFQY